MSNKPEMYDIDNSYPMQLRMSLMAMQESLNTRFREAGYGVTHQQWVILAHLSQEDGLSQQELATRYKSSKVTILRFIDRLEKLGYVIRQKDPNDGRRNNISLTDEGNRVQAELAPLALDNANRMSQGISDEEMKIVISALKTIIANGKM